MASIDAETVGQWIDDLRDELRAEIQAESDTREADLSRIEQRLDDA